MLNWKAFFTKNIAKPTKYEHNLRKSIPSGKKGIVLMESIYSFVWVRGCDVT